MFLIPSIAVGISTSLYAESLPVMEFNDLKSKFLDAENILIILNFSKCTTVSEKIISGLALPRPEDGHIIAESFTTKEAVLTSDNNVESLTIPYNENIISTLKLNTTISGPTVKVTGNLEITSSHNIIYFLRASGTTNNAESSATYQCGWDTLTIKSHY